MIAHGKKRGSRRRPEFRVRPGTAPGLIADPPPGSSPVIRVVGYGPDGFCEEVVGKPDDIKRIKAEWPKIWVHVEGLGDLQVLKDIQEVFSLHNLAVEDVVNQNQRPKVEVYEDHYYLVLLHARRGPALVFDQVNIFIGDGFVLSLQMEEGKWDELVRKRIREGRTRIRRLPTSYLAYALMDSIVDHYFPLIEELGRQIEDTEDEVLSYSGREDISRIHDIRSDLLFMRRALQPLGEALDLLSQEEMSLVGSETRTYIRDCRDHVAQLLDSVETDREATRSLVEMCLSSASNRMNEVMKVLTIIATIFIPLSFIAGVYGMNFSPEASPFNMPELKWHFGYPFALVLMALTAGGLLLFFRRKRWFGSKPFSK